MVGLVVRFFLTPDDAGEVCRIGHVAVVAADVDRLLAKITRGSRVEAAVLAVLDATNRWFLSRQQ